MTTYYRSPEVLITSEIVATMIPQWRMFRIDELYDLCVVRGERRPGRLLGVWRAGPRSYELWANYRGVPVRLCWTYDETSFGQIKRALLRSVENNADRQERRYAGPAPRSSREHAHG